MKKGCFALFLLAALAGCNQHQVGPTFMLPDSLQLAVDRQEAISQKLAMYRQLDSPTFDDASVTRQFPYGPGTITQAPRLIQTKENGAVTLNYRYDTAGHLVEAYYNFLGLDEAASRQLNQYDEHGLKTVAYYWGSLPGFQLGLVRAYTFFTNQQGRIDRYYDSSGGSKQLRFDESGHLIWVATGLNGYTRAHRDSAHNIQTLRSTLDGFYTIDYAYDTHPNPFYWLKAPDFTSPNNVVKETKRNLMGDVLSVTEYQYDYRPDGYPIRKRSGTQVIEYVYEN